MWWGDDLTRSDIPSSGSREAPALPNKKQDQSSLTHHGSSLHRMNKKIIRFGPMPSSGGTSSQINEGLLPNDLYMQTGCTGPLSPNKCSQLEYRHKSDWRLLITLQIDHHDRVECVIVENWLEAQSQKWDWKFIQWLMPQWHDGVSAAHMKSLQSTVDELVKDAASVVERQIVKKLPWVPDPAPDGTDQRQVQFSATRKPAGAITLVVRYIDYDGGSSTALN